MSSPTRPLRRAVLCGGVAASLSLLALRCSHQLHQGASVGATQGQKGSREQRKLYARTIVLGSNAGVGAQRAAADLVELLTRATGEPFALASSAERGIFLLRADDPLAPPAVASRLKGESREPYVICSRPNGSLLIVANGDDGLIFGAYQYLESLGFRFYFPNPRWTIVPKLENIERAEDRLVKPDFRVRQFVGTGGLGKGLAVDPSGALATQWNVWKQRNGFGEEFHLDGHSGEGFNVRHKETLIAHPEFLASVNGRRAAWSKIAKIDPSNPRAVDLFVQDRLQTYREKRQRDPNGPGSFAVSVEPADGGGDCDSPECAKIGNVSNQQFSIANQVARALAKEFPNAKASLFAYNLHATIPTIPIEPNVYVTLVPYAFQRHGEDPEEFIAEWAKKKSPLSIYDYWSIPDWAADLPTFDYRNAPTSKLRYWHAEHIEGFLGESTYSAGAMGLPWFIAGHLMWNVQADAGALTDNFFRDCFGEAAAPMRHMLERWAAGFALNAVELHSSFADLSEAFRLAKSGAVLGRLVDYAAYLQYLRLRHEWTMADKSNVEARKRALIVHLWRTYQSAMLDTFRLQQLLLRKDATLGPELDPTRPDLPIWKSLSPFDEREARACVNQGLRDFPDLGFQRRAFEGPLLPVPAAALDSVSSAPTPSPSNLTLVGSNSLEVTVPPGLSRLTVEVTISSELDVRFRRIGGPSLFSSHFEASSSPQTFSATVPEPGTYCLELRTGKNAQVKVELPAELGVELTGFRIPKAVPVPDLYFFVPAGERAVGIHDPIALPLGSGAILLDASGEEVPLERRDGGRLLVARVPPHEDGKIWTLRRAVAPDGPLVMLNVPQRLSLSPRSLRVPSSALDGLSKAPAEAAR